MNDRDYESKTDVGRNTASLSLAQVEASRAPPTTANVAPLPSLNLSPEQWATAEELTRLDPQLSGLYRMGLELLSRADEVGVSYLIAHAGRELSRGVVSLLAGADVVLPEDQIAEIPDNERNRVAIGTILQLPPSHPLVTQWFRTHADLVKFVHFKQSMPATEEICRVFLRLSDLLFGRIGPYFATHSQLDAFLRIESPDATVVERARPVLTRPVQRQYFFLNLTHARWLSHLAGAGQFASPPEMLDLGDGRWQLQPWPEGEYLIRMATQEPEAVTDILVRIPKGIKNPVVWDAVARAAAVLPAEFAERVTGHLENALKETSLPNWFSPHVTPVVSKLAEGRREAAFRLAACLLWLNKPPATEAVASVSQMSRSDSEWVLARLDSYALGEFLKDAVPTLESFKAGKTLALLSKTLDRALWLVEEMEGHSADYQRRSTVWCRRLDGSESDGDVRAQLATALAGVVTRAAAAGEAQAAKAFKTLARYNREIFQRIKIVALTSAGHFAREHLDEIIADPRILDSPPSPQEYASLLRAQFGNASPSAQRLFAYALERGPEPDQVGALLSRWSVEPTEEGVREIVKDWQQRRLRWFRDQIPELLLPLAERLGVEPGQPGEEERALNEEGFYSTGVRWVGDPSPMSDEQFASMTPDDIASYLETWRPEATQGREGPTISGLAQTLSRYAAGQPEPAGYVAEKSVNHAIAPEYVTALLRGFKEASEKGQTIPWPRALRLVAFAVTRVDEVGRKGGNPNSARSWRWAASSAAQLVEHGCAKDHISPSLAYAVWRILNNAFASDATWAPGDVPEDFKTFNSVISAGLNTLSGHFVDALIDASLWEYRRAYPGEEGEEAKDRSAATARLVPLLEGVLGRGGRAGIAAQAMLGCYIPQVYLMARSWTLEAAARMFEGGATSPVTKPVWGAYLVRALFVDTVFQDLRPWYMATANAIGDMEEGTDSRDGDLSLSRNLARHVMTAVIRGVAAVGDADGLVERTFRTVNVADRAHTYWSVFRGWSDSKVPVGQDVVTRLVRFWEWRLEELEAAEETPTRVAEAAGLRWLLATPYINTADALRLGRRTLDLSAVELEDRGASLWGRLAEMAAQDADGAYEIAERLIQKILAREHPYLPFERVAPTIQPALSSGDEQIKKRAERLVNKLGEHGLYDYGKLLGTDDADK